MKPSMRRTCFAIPREPYESSNRSQRKKRLPFAPTRPDLPAHRQIAVRQDGIALMSEIKRYFQGLSQHVGAAWNRFWFEPSDALDLCVLRFFVGLLALLWHASFGFDLVRWFGRDGWLAGDTMQRLHGRGCGGARCV